MCLYPYVIRKRSSLHTVDLVELPQYLKDNIDEDFLVVPCGKCFECQKDYSTEWAFRMNDELKCCSGVGCVLTLTYADGSALLSKRDVQLFLKRLRKKVGQVRYFACGEYGSKNGRPHYHVAIFGWLPDDLTYWKKSKRGNVQYRSATVEQLWKDGFSTVGFLDFRTAFYTAKYLQKFVYVPDGLQRPFTLMSRHPGIGFSQIENVDFVNDKVYCNGRYRKIPRYYLKVKERNGFDLKTLKEKRKEKCRLCSVDNETIKKNRKKQQIFVKGY